MNVTDNYYLRHRADKLLDTLDAEARDHLLQQSQQHAKAHCVRHDNWDLYDTVWHAYISGACMQYNAK